MDGVNKKYRSKQLRRYSELQKFIDEANKERYDIVSITQSDIWYTVVYMDY